MSIEARVAWLSVARKTTSRTGLAGSRGSVAEVSTRTCVLAFTSACEAEERRRACCETSERRVVLVVVDWKRRTICQTLTFVLVKTSYTSCTVLRVDTSEATRRAS